MAVVDPVFAPLLAGKTFGVWRVTQLRLTVVPERDWGKFFSGDCYLVFSSVGGEHIFFWLGAESSNDEQTVAAMKAVELDNLFNGMPVQHREIQGHESVRFRKLFRDGIVTLLGGTESGLRQVDKVGHVPRLFQVRGGKTPALTEVELNWSAMNHGDTFVVDTGSHIFIWAGETSSGMEKMVAAGLASKLRDRLGEEIVHILDGEEDGMAPDELEAWIKVLPLEDKNNVKAAEHENDRKVDQNLAKEIALFKCSDFSGELEIQLVKRGELEGNDLDGDDAFIVDGNHQGIWVWLGRRSNAMERKEAMGAGQKFIEKRGLDKNTRLTKVNMGREPEEFKSLFMKW